MDEPVWLNIDLLGGWPLGQLPFLISILTLSGRFASSSPKGRAFDIIGNFPMTVKTSHFGGGGIAQAMTERVSQFIVLILSSITQNAAPGYPETTF